LPWHSSISRTHQLYPAAVFEHLFDKVFAQCVAAGLVAGDTQLVNSAPVKAAASLQTWLAANELMLRDFVAINGYSNDFN
jgi:hypothetical protein